MHETIDCQKIVLNLGLQRQSPREGERDRGVENIRSSSVDQSIIPSPASPEKAATPGGHEGKKEISITQGNVEL